MSFVQVPPDSTGKKVYAKQHTVGADTVQAQIVHLADEINPAHLAAIDVKGALNVRFAEGQPILGGFGGLKIAGERVLGVYESSLDTYATLFSNVFATGGALTYDAQASSEVLSVTGANGSLARSTTNRYHYYLPGSANIMKMTVACGDTGKVGNRRSWGAFDTSDGVFFQLRDTGLGLVLRSSVTGSVVDTFIPQSSWNVDKVDGTGISGFDIDITKVNIYWIDYQWLGAGRVRYGVFAPDGSRITCHEIQNAGANALPYMRTGTLPLALENVNTALVGSASELRSVCLAAYTEGTYEDYTFWRFSDAEMNGVTVSGTETQLLTVQALTTVNGKHNSVIAYPETLNVYTDQPIALTLWQDTQPTGGTWSSLASVLEQNSTCTLDLVNAQKFRTIYFAPGAHNVSLDQYFELNDEGIQVGSDGISEAWSITAKKLGGTDATVSVNLGYKELW